MVLLGLLAVEAEAAARSGVAAVRRGAWRPLPGVHVALGQRDDPLVIDVAGGRDDDVRAEVARLVVGGDVGDRDRADHVGGAEDPLAERVLAEDRLGEEVVDAVGGLVLVHRDLLDHDLALGVDVGEGRPEEHLGEQVEGGLGVLVEEARVEVGRLLARRRVGRRAETVEVLGDLDRRVTLGALEQQMLEKVRERRPGRRLVARAGPDARARARLSGPRERAR